MNLVVQSFFFHNPIFSKRITGEELHWHNVVGGSLYIGASAPIANGTDFRTIVVNEDHFMHCCHCERETLMRYEEAKGKPRKMFWSRKVPAFASCLLWPKDCYHFR